MSTTPRTTAQLQRSPQAANQNQPAPAPRSGSSLDSGVADESASTGAEQSAPPVEQLSWFHDTARDSERAMARAEDMLARYENARAAIHDEYGAWFSGAARRDRMAEFETFEAEFLSRCHSVVEVMAVDTDDIRLQVALARDLDGHVAELYAKSVADYQENPGVPAFERAQGRWNLASDFLQQLLDHNVEAAKHLSWVETTLDRGRSEFSSDVRHSGVELDPIVDAALAAMQTEVTAYLAHKIGAGGAGFTRSRELRAFRQRMKNAARDQARSDIDRLATEGGPVTATSDYTATDAKPRVYKTAKQSVDRRLHQLASDQAANLVQAQRGALTAAGNSAALDALGSGTEAATAAAKKAVESRAQDLTEQALAAAKTWKNSLIKNPDGGQMEAMQSAEESQVRSQTQKDSVGEKALERSITANTTDEGLGKVGKLIDATLPQPGDSAKLAIELQIPLGQTPGFVSLGLEGTAARGTDGAVTAGIPVLGDNPRRMEAMVKFELGGGAEFFGLRADGSVGFFLRSAGQDTTAAMKAMNYGAYRAACGLSDRLGDWWSGATAGTGRTRRHKAESWAAMVEEQVFAADDSAFAHLGVGGKVNASMDFGVLEGKASLGGARFRKWNQASLQDSLGDAFAAPVASDREARNRRAQASGAPGASIGGSVSVSANILGQGVDFSASLSGSASDFADNWGVEITSGVSLPPGADASTFATIAAGIVAGALSAAQSLGAMVKGNPRAGGVDLFGDIATIANAGLENQLSTYLGELWQVGSGDDAEPGLALGSAIEVALLFGRGSGQGIFRVELRSKKSAAVKIGMGNVGLSGSIERTKRLAAFGRDGGHGRAEVLGNHLA